MNAPKSVMFLTWPSRRSPTCSSLTRFSRLRLRSSSRTLRRADHDVLPLGVDLDDLGLDDLADVLADVRRAAQVDLRGGQEDRHADVDEQAALDLAQHLAADGVAFLVVAEDLVPADLEVRLALREDHLAVGHDLDDHHLDLGADLRVVLVELLAGHVALALVADVDDDVVVVLGDDEAGDDGAQLEAAAVAVEVGEQGLLGVGAEGGFEFGGHQGVVDDADSLKFGQGHGGAFSFPAAAGACRRGVGSAGSGPVAHARSAGTSGDGSCEGSRRIWGWMGSQSQPFAVGRGTLGRCELRVASRESRSRESRRPKLEARSSKLAAGAQSTH